MKICNKILLLIVAASGPALADVRLDIHVASMDAVECFDAATCSPQSASARVQNLPDGEIFDVPVTFDVPTGDPLAYQFIIEGDDLVTAPASLIEFTVEWSGPNFQYTSEYSWEPSVYSYSFGPAFPPPIPQTVPAGFGCIAMSELNWTHANFPIGVGLISDFTVPADSTLYIEAGMGVYCDEGVTIIIEGNLEAFGDTDNWINFIGDNWGGLTMGSAADGNIEYARIIGVEDDSDGGALNMLAGSSLWLNNCLISDNSTIGMGGAVYLADGAHLHLRSSTVSHNSADMGGGNIYIADGGLLSGSLNLVTFGTPETMVAETGTLTGNLQSSNVYPLDDPDQGTGWYCDPGYVDPDNNVFDISFWSLEDPDAVNCTIDVSQQPGELDPDGTAKDMGAFPFNQFDILRPATIVGVMDNPGDEGGSVQLAFAASPNDGSWINPITFYNVWVLYPGTEDYVNTGQTIGAMGDEGYVVSVATSVDSMGTDSLTYGHHFLVSAHNSMNAQLVAISNEGWGYSIDNLAPEAVSNLVTEDLWDDDHEGNIRMTFSWDVSPANDFDHFEVFIGEEDIFENADPMGDQVETSFIHVAQDEDEGSIFYYFVRAVDYHGNIGEVTSVNSPVATDVLTDLPTHFDLAQNYPNPFNPSTTIGFAVPQAGNVSLRVYNMQGQMVKELVNGFQDVGRYELSFDASHLASGVYLYHIEAGDFVETRKMVLMK